MDSNTVAAIEDGYYAVVESLPNLVKDLEKVVESGKIKLRRGALEFIEFLKTGLSPSHS